MHQEETMEPGSVAKVAVADVDQARCVGLSDFKKVSTLGRGSFGIVVLVRKQSGIDQGKLYAMKTNHKLNHHRIAAEKELHILQAVKNMPFLLQLEYAFKTSKGLHLVVQYLNRGSLRSRAHFSTYEVMFMTAELVLAVEQLHNLGIVHRDIKPDNILLDDDSHIVLCDFGISVQFSKDDEIKKTKENYIVSAYKYAAPEIVNLLDHGFAADWWAVGIVMYHMLTMRSPFRGDCVPELFRRIASCKPDIDPRLPANVRHFIKDLLEKDGDKRLGSRAGGVEELKSHDVFKRINWEDLLRRKCISPVRRIC